MTISIARNYPRPVLAGRYRYSRLRWRVLVFAFDFVGAAAMRAWRIFRPKPRVDRPRSILLVQLDHLGDSVLTTPMIGPLRAAYPEASIDVLATPSNAAVFEAEPEIRNVLVAADSWFDRRGGPISIARSVARLGRQLRSPRYDLGIDVRGDVLSVLALALARIPRRLGWAMGGGGFLLTDVAPWQAGRHEVESRALLLKTLGVDAPEAPRVSVHVSDADRAAVARWLAGEWPTRERRGQTEAAKAAKPSGSWHRTRPPVDGELLHAGRFGDDAPLLAVHLGAGTPAKRWPLEHWRTLIEKFVQSGWRIVVVGGPHEASVRLGLPPHPNLRDWTAQTSVTQTTALLERADLFIGADSGPAHLAACAAVPSVVLFSGTNQAAQWRPWSRASLVLRERVPCQPCHRKVCPLADHPCLSAITPQRVFETALRWWSRFDGFQGPRTLPAPAPARKALTQAAQTESNH